MSKKITISQFMKLAFPTMTHSAIDLALKNEDVKIDSKAIKNAHFQFNPNKTEVFYLESKVSPTQRKLAYFLFNKPLGTISQKGPESIYQYIDALQIETGIKESLFPIGRLDVYTEGLMIITNDGVLSHFILNPISKIKKTYRVMLDKFIIDIDLKKIEEGIKITIKDEKGEREIVTQKAEVVRIEDTIISLSIHEGKKRQIRRMIKELGYEVISLKRIAIGNLELGTLKTGELREVSKEDIIKKLQ